MVCGFDIKFVLTVCFVVVIKFFKNKYKWYFLKVYNYS